MEIMFCFQHLQIPVVRGNHTASLKMSAKGRYVRYTQFSNDASDVTVHESDTMEDLDAGRYVRAPKFYDDEQEEQNDEYDDYRITVDPNLENEMLKQQLADMQRVIDEISSKRQSQQQHNAGINAAEDSWNSSRTMPSSLSEGSGPSIRWDQMKPFPKNVPANRMWEEWSKYIENFEIASSLSNATDPVRRSQLLFLSMGDQLQSIVRAAKLLPNLNDKQCYKVFIKNIEDHLRSMTDTSAEHEAFSRMQQGKGESVMNFHARLVEKVRLCRYSTGDQERFIRAQLLKGMLNRELARTARTFDHETNFIVQAATRDEAYERETTHATSMEDESINQVRGRMPRTMKREGRGEPSGSQNKKFRLDTQRSSSRRNLCSRCNQWNHRKRPCPALKPHQFSARLRSTAGGEAGY